jgi:hypothetical protein
VGRERLRDNSRGNDVGAVRQLPGADYHASATGDCRGFFAERRRRRIVAPAFRLCTRDASLEWRLHALNSASIERPGDPTPFTSSSIRTIARGITTPRSSSCSQVPLRRRSRGGSPRRSYCCRLHSLGDVPLVGQRVRSRSLRGRFLGVVPRRHGTLLCHWACDAMGSTCVMCMLAIT